MSSQEEEAKLAKQREKKEAAERKAADEEYSRQAQAQIQKNLKEGKYDRKPFTPEEQAYIDDLKKRIETEQDPLMKQRMEAWISKKYMGFQRTFEEYSSAIDARIAARKAAEQQEQ